MPVTGDRGNTENRDSTAAPGRVEDPLRELAPQVLAALVRRYGQFHLCEDASQEALPRGNGRPAGSRRTRADG
jgi:hypothetical protein